MHCLRTGCLVLPLIERIIIHLMDATDVGLRRTKRHRAQEALLFDCFIGLWIIFGGNAETVCSIATTKLVHTIYLDVPTPTSSSVLVLIIRECVTVERFLFAMVMFDEDGAVVPDYGSFA